MIESGRIPQQSFFQNKIKLRTQRVHGLKPNSDLYDHDLGVYLNMGMKNCIFVIEGVIEGLSCNTPSLAMSTMLVRLTP